MNFASAVVFTVIVVLVIMAVRHLLKKGSGCAACGHEEKGGCNLCNHCNACKSGGCSTKGEPVINNVCNGDSALASSLPPDILQR